MSAEINNLITQIEMLLGTEREADPVSIPDLAAQFSMLQSNTYTLQDILEGFDKRLRALESGRTQLLENILRVLRELPA